MQILKDEIKNILVVNLGGIGDLLLSTPALRALKKDFPSAKLYLLVVGRCREAVERLSCVDGVFVFPAEKDWRGIIACILSILKLRQIKMDLAVNMRTLVSEKGALKMKILFKLINPRIKAGRDTSGRGGFLDISIPETDIGEKSEIEYDIDTVKALGVAVIDKNVDFLVDEKTMLDLRDMLSQSGIGAKDILIGINPGGRPSRRWPRDNFVELIKAVKKEYKAKFVITGVGADEIELAETIAAKSGPDVVSLAGKLNLSQLASLISMCRLYITNDTGSMHIAAILNTPLIAIFGPGHLKRFDPRNIFSEAVVLYQKTVCAPCNRFKCSSLQCLTAVLPEEVAEAAIRLLGGR